MSNIMESMFSDFEVSVFYPLFYVHKSSLFQQTQWGMLLEHKLYWTPKILFWSNTMVSRKNPISLWNMLIQVVKLHIVFIFKSQQSKHLKMKIFGNWQWVEMVKFGQLNTFHKSFIGNMESIYNSCSIFRRHRYNGIGTHCLST